MESNSLVCSTGDDAERVLRRAAQHHDLHLLRRIAQAEVVGDRRQVLRRLAVDRHQDVAGLQAGRLRRPARPDVRHDHPGVARQAEAAGHLRRDGLQAHAHFLPPQLPVLLELPERRAHRRARNREAESVAAARRREDERVDADDLAADVDERPARVARVDRRVGLQVDERRVRIRLPRDSRDEPMRERVRSGRRGCRTQTPSRPGARCEYEASVSAGSLQACRSSAARDRARC